MRISNRQRLINMMYLVLLALLALNIQVDFIDAFFDLSTSIERTVNKLELEKKQKFLSIEEVYQIDSVKYKDAYLKSLDAITITEEAIMYIDSIQNLIIDKTGGFNQYGYPVNSVDPRISDKVLIQRKGAKNLKEKLFSTKKQIESLMEGNSLEIDSMFSTQNFIINSRGERLSWEEYHFNNLALGGCLAILSGFKKDVKMMEYTILNHFQNKIFGKLTSFIIPDDMAGEDRIDMAVVKEKLYEIGDKIRIDLKGKKNIVYINKEVKIFDENDKEIKETEYYFEDGYLYFTPNKKGKFKVYANLTEENGISKKLESEFDVSPNPEDKYVPVNELINSENDGVLYVGVKNKIRINYPKQEFSDLKLTSSSGKLHRKKEYYYLIPKRTGKLELTLKTKSEKVKRSFVVKNLPDPSPYINNASSGQISSKMFKIQKGIFAKIEGINFSKAYDIISFKMSRINANGQLIFNKENDGSYFENDILNEVRKSEPGDTYFFNKIYVKSLDGRSRYISSLVLEIK